MSIAVVEVANKLPPHFRRLWVGETFAAIGTQLTAVAIPIVVITVLHASSAQVAWLNMAEAAAVIVAGVFAGGLSDRPHRKMTLIAVNLARAAAISVIPIAYWLDSLSLPLVVAAVFIVAGLGAIFDATMSGYVNDIIAPTHLLRANSYLQATQSTGEVGGPGLAGVLIAVVGAPVGVIVNAGTYLGSVLALLTMPRATEVEPQVRDMDDNEAPSTQSRGAFGAISVGMRGLWRSAAVRATTLAATHFNFFTSTFFALYLFHLLSTLHISSLALGIIFAAGGVGGIVGGVIAERVARRWSARAVLSVVSATPGVCAAVVAATTTDDTSIVVLVAAMGAVWSLCVVVNITVCETLKQQSVPAGEIGRVSSAIRVLSWGVELGGAGLAAVLVTIGVSPESVMMIAAIGLVTSPIWVARLRHVWQ